MPHKTPGGFAIVLPEMGIDAMLKASQSEFLERLLAKNPTLTASQLTKHNLFSCVMGLIARLGQEGPFSAGIKAQIQVVQQQVGAKSSGR